jgi:hypothetical protein
MIFSYQIELTALIIADNVRYCNDKTQNSTNFLYIKGKKKKSTSYSGALMTRTGFEPVLPP